MADFPRFITIFEESNLTGRGLFNARSVPAHFEPNLLQRWIQECNNNHEKCRMSSRIMNGLWLIDVTNRQLVVAPKRCQYFALSYVYGGVKINKLARDLPRTIEDAIQLVKILGYRYFWIDTLCLTKDHLEDHQTRSQVMNLVYGCAFVTIVAAPGVNAQKGLPGIPGSEKRARSHMYHCEVIKGQKSGIQLPSLREQISNSKWSTRAWTFQESLFSKRYLIVTDEQTYWECSQAAYCEAVKEPVDTFLDMTVLPSFSRVLGNSFSEQRDFKDLYF